MDTDRQIAEKIMGWYSSPGTHGMTYFTSHYPWHDRQDEYERVVADWQPSTNIVHAFEVVGELSKQGYRVQITIIEGGHGVEVVIFKPGIGKKSKRHLEDEVCTEYDPKAPRAICLAALEAVKPTD